LPEPTGPPMPTRAAEPTFADGDGVSMVYRSM
jgi:hypothetical protein